MQVLSDITKDYLIRDDHDHFKSYCLSFPSLSELLNDMPVYDVHKTHECKTTVIHMLLETHHENLIDTFHKKRQNISSPNFSTQDMGIRHFLSTLLSYISHNQKHAEELLLDYHDKAQNLTERMTALSLLNYWDCPSKTTALTQFYKEYKDTPTVLNKWFSVQTTSQSTKLIHHLESLEKDKKFNIKNPNNCRALFGGFMQNLPAFHAKDGSGLHVYCK